MLNRRQMMSQFAGGVLIGSVGLDRAMALTRQGQDRTAWLPQLSKTAQTIAEAEAKERRFAPGLVHRVAFMPGVTLLTYRTRTEDAACRLHAVQTTLRRQGVAMSRPGVTPEGKSWALFVCLGSDDVAGRLGDRAGRVFRHRARAA